MVPILQNGSHAEWFPSRMVPKQNGSQAEQFPGRMVSKQLTKMCKKRVNKQTKTNTRPITRLYFTLIIHRVLWIHNHRFISVSDLFQYVCCHICVLDVFLLTEQCYNFSFPRDTTIFDILVENINSKLGWLCYSEMILLFSLI